MQQQVNHNQQTNTGRNISNLFNFFCILIKFSSGGDIFQRPQEVYSSGGELKTRLIVDVGNVSIDWLSVQRRLYNGTFPGPTIRIRPNDMLYLQLVSCLCIDVFHVYPTVIE